MMRIISKKGGIFIEATNYALYAEGYESNSKYASVKLSGCNGSDALVLYNFNSDEHKNAYGKAVEIINRIIKYVALNETTTIDFDSFIDEKNVNEVCILIEYGKEMIL